MASKTVKVGSTVGLHARPATVIAEAAGEYDDDIILTLVGGCLLYTSPSPRD